MSTLLVRQVAYSFPMCVLQPCIIKSFSGPAPISWRITSHSAPQPAGASNTHSVTVLPMANGAK